MPRPAGSARDCAYDLTTLEEIAVYVFLGAHFFTVFVFSTNIGRLAIVILVIEVFFAPLIISDFFIFRPRPGPLRGFTVS